MQDGGGKRERRLVKVKTKLAVHAHRRTLELLDGEYSSIHHGRSHDFDDLREYTPGDEVKDIDWKATARSSVPLVKRYVASRQHNVVLVVDTGRNMAATAEGGESKREIVTLAAGVLGYIAIKHGDRVALVAGDEERLVVGKEGGSEGHLERVLRTIDELISLDAPPSNVARLLRELPRRIPRRALVLVISDDLAFTSELDQLVGKAQLRHELLWLTVGDADLIARGQRVPRIYGVEGASVLPEFLRRDKRLSRAYDEGIVAREELAASELRSLGIARARVSSSERIIAELFRLLERHRRVRR